MGLDIRTYLTYHMYVGNGNGSQADPGGEGGTMSQRCGCMVGGTAQGHGGEHCDYIAPHSCRCQSDAVRVVEVERQKYDYERESTTPADSPVFYEVWMCEACAEYATQPRGVPACRDCGGSLSVSCSCDQATK